MSPQVPSTATAGVAEHHTPSTRGAGTANDRRAPGEFGRRAGDALFRALVEQLPAIIYIERPGDADTCTFISPQVEAILGFPAADVVRQPGLLASRVHPDDRERVRLEGERTTRTGDPFRMEYRIQARDGRWVWLRNEAVLIHDEHGQALHWLGVALDITSQRETEAALRESEQRFGALVQHSYDVITIVALDGTRRYISPSIEPVLGYAVDDLVGGNALDLVHPDDTERLRAAMALCRDGAKQTPVIDLRFRHRDGDWREFEAIGTNLLDEPAVAGIVFNSREVTARKTTETALRASEERFRAAFDHAPIGFAIFAPDGLLRQVNRALCGLLGFTEEELLGTSMPHLVHPDDVPDVQAQIARLFNGEIATCHMDARCVRKDGRTVWVQKTVSVVRDEDGPRYGIAHIRDVTDTRHLEMERAIMLASEREYTRQLRELTGMRSDLSAMVAHELNTPIASLKVLTAMLGTNELSAPEVATTIAAMYDQLDQLDRLAADVAASAAAERDDFSVQLHPVPLAVLLGGASASAATIMSGHPFTLQPPANVRVWCDPERIGQVLQNLLGNAAKHTLPGTPVALRARRTRGSDWVRFEVADQGSGIAAEDQRLIFEKFGRARATAARETPGAGLGLYVSRGIVEAHGSELTVESTPGQGTLFAFSLKVAP